MDTTQNMLKNITLTSSFHSVKQSLASQKLLPIQVNSARKNGQTLTYLALQNAN